MALASLGDWLSSGRPMAGQIPPDNLQGLTANRKRQREEAKKRLDANLISFVMIASCHLPVSFLYFPIFCRRRTDLHQDKTTRIRVLLSYSTSRWSGSQGIKKDGYVVELAMCTLHANASRIVTRKEEEKRLTIIGPTWISKNHVISHTDTVLRIQCWRSRWEKDSG